MAFVVAISIPHIASAAAYTILDLGTLGGTNSYGGYGINASGQVVGASQTTNNVAKHAFRTAANSPMTAASNLGTLGGTDSFSNGVNASGQAVGYVYISGSSATNGVFHAFRTAANGPINAASDLGTLGGTWSFGRGINDGGQTVGYAYLTGNTTYHAFRTAGNGPINAATDLGTLGGLGSEAYGVNASGQAVGFADITGSAARHAFRTDANGLITATTDLGTLGGAESGALAINDSGQAVGFADTSVSGVHHAFRTAANGLITAESDLGTLGGTSAQANGVNSIGQAVGQSTLIPGSHDFHACFIDLTGPMRDLNDLIPTGSGWVLQEAHGINDLGQISGVGTIDGQTQHAFLLIPTPEPTSLAVMGVGCVGLLSRHRRAKVLHHGQKRGSI